MKFSIILLAAATIISAAEFPGQPACASPCITQAISQGTNCDIEDLACQCQPSNLAGISTAIVPCILGSCTAPGELQQAQAAPNQCDNLGSSTATTSSESSTSETSSASPGSSTTSGPASTTASDTRTTGPTTTSRPTNGTFTTSRPTATSTAGEVTQNAAHSVGLAGVGGMVGLLAAVVAAL
ncbi:a259e408-dc24-49e8-b836-5a204fbb4068 [Sclerotinia trifoliorum]|uniref:A259e408-dc24-49e8-b836-5a204fbb4068 n=1 Tax=Sclerotinia trifoliorum TaxID=28548 RepID=A0A8H2ZNY4_9HELO|nr:a259e408-dc24-49e8-b836-5a204fbb4068 [Sclerotinia trifoliorum]